ncbi:DNA-binding response regulator [Spirochaetia bacterium]|nr:DNA-binding response regulator [Spirochaetia bacterium]
MINVVAICSKNEDQEQISNLLSAHEDFQIAGVGKDGYDALQTAEKLKPNVVVMDLLLPDIDGFELAPIIKRKSPNTGLVVLSSLNENHYAGRAIKAGIAGYLLKPADMGKLAASIKIVFSGSYYISAPIIDRVFCAISFLRYFPGQNEELANCWFNYKINHQAFSSAERGIITLMTQGLTDDEIADDLHLSPGTLRNYLSAIKRKMGVKTRIQIVIYALKYGLVNFNQINMSENY